jgi:probable addiction module antidote protein
MTVKTERLDIAELLETPEDIAAFIASVLEEDGDDPVFIQQALGVAARAKGMSEMARAADIDRASLYKALSEEGNPTFSTISKVVKALGLKLKIAAA